MPTSPDSASRTPEEQAEEATLAFISATEKLIAGGMPPDELALRVFDIAAALEKPAC